MCEWTVDQLIILYLGSYSGAYPCSSVDILSVSGTFLFDSSLTAFYSSVSSQFENIFFLHKSSCHSIILLVKSFNTVFTSSFTHNFVYSVSLSRLLWAFRTCQFSYEFSHLPKASPIFFFIVIFLYFFIFLFDIFFPLFFVVWYWQFLFSHYIFLLSKAFILFFPGYHDNLFYSPLGSFLLWNFENIFFMVSLICSYSSSGSLVHKLSMLNLFLSLILHSACISSRTPCAGTFSLFNFLHSTHIYDTSNSWPVLQFTDCTPPSTTPYYVVNFYFSGLLV